MAVIPQVLPPHLADLVELGFNHYITDHPEYKQRKVDAARLKEDQLVFQSAFVFGYMARLNEEKNKS